MAAQPSQDGEAAGSEQPITAAEDVRSDIPWQRESRAFLSSPFWATVFYVLKRRGRIADQIDRVESLAAARKFRRGVFLHAAAGWVAVALSVLLVQGAEVQGVKGLGLSGNATLIVGVGLAAQIVILLLGMSISAWFFAWPKASREAEDRAIAIGYYCCAPLALVAAAPLVFAVSLFFLPIERMFTAAGYAALAAMCVWAMWAWLTVNVSGRIKGRTKAGNLRATGALAGLWVLLHVCVASTPMLVLMWLLMWVTLR